MPFKVEIGRIDRIFSLLIRAPKKMLTSSDVEPIVIGKAALFFPLREARVEIISSGATDYALRCSLALHQVQVTVQEKGEKKLKIKDSELKLDQIPAISVPELNAVFINKHGYSIQTEDGEEIYSIYQGFAGAAIIISAGIAGAISSPPPKVISTPLELKEELETFASIIQAVVNAFYNYQLEICHANLAKKWAVELIKRMRVNTFLHLQGPISNDKKSLPGEDDDSNDDDDEEDDDEPTTDDDGSDDAFKPIKPKNIEYGLDDVAGIEDAKATAWEIVETLRDPDKFTRLGGKTPKGALLEGPPGNGKTMLAQAIAKEAGVPFFAVLGSDFVEKYVGVGAARVRDLFLTAAKHAKRKKTSVIIFFDEIDAVAGKRDGEGGGAQERSQTLNALLGQIDGFQANKRVVVIAATNRSDILDAAITRPGRLDRRIVIHNPDLEAREAILIAHARKKTMKNDIDYRQIARITIGFSGADLANLINEAAIRASKNGKDAIEEEDILESMEKITMGAERRIKNMPKEELTNTAYHEAGHTLLHEIFRPLTDPIQKVTIVPRGHALGLTIPQPIVDKYSSTKAQVLKQMCALMGGRAAEIILSGEKNYTTGASKDIEMATELAQQFVRRWGMSRELGPVNLGGNETHVYLGYHTGNSSNISPDTQKKIDAVIKDLCEKALKRAILVLMQQRKTLDALANALLEKETLNHNQIEKIIVENTAAETVSPEVHGMAFARIGE